MIVSGVREKRPTLARGFSLLELLVVIAIISTLIAILIPGMRRSRENAKAASCLSVIKGIGTAIATYANTNGEHLPPPIIDWHPSLVALKSPAAGSCGLPVIYGWAELLYEQIVPSETVDDVVEFEPGHWSNFPAQRNYADKYGRIFNCPAAQVQITHGGHFRLYEPGWVPAAFGLDDQGRLERRFGGLDVTPQFSRLKATIPILAEANEYSSSGDYDGPPKIPHCPNADLCPEHESSWVAIGQIRGSSDSWNMANGIVDSCGSTSGATRFLHRHYGGANYLFGDLHAERSTDLRPRLACDWDLNGVADCKGDASLRASGCDPIYDGL